MKRIAITGIGIVAPSGIDKKVFWANVKAEASESLERYAEQLRARGIETTAVVAEGYAATAIVDEIGNQNAVIPRKQASELLERRRRHGPAMQEDQRPALTGFVPCQRTSAKSLELPFLHPAYSQ